MRLKQRDQKSLWKHMAKTCALRLMNSREYRDRDHLHRELIRCVNAGSYAPAGTSGFLSAPKFGGVPRFIPVLPYSDTAVYFASMQHLDKNMANAAVPQTFGAWRISTNRRGMEEREAMRI